MAPLLLCSRPKGIEKGYVHRELFLFFLAHVISNLNRRLFSWLVDRLQCLAWHTSLGTEQYLKATYKLAPAILLCGHHVDIRAPPILLRGHQGQPTKKQIFS